jgi:predicted PurR-regulated permease PerM
MTDTPPAHSLGNRASGIVATGTILAILYFARDVLVPVTLAVILSLLISPVVRALRHLGAGATTSVLVAALAFAVVFGSFAAVIGMQVARLAASLPQYEHTIHDKWTTLNAFAARRLNAINSQAGRIIGGHAEQPAVVAAPATTAPIPVELRALPMSPAQAFEKVLGSVWVPLETAGIVLVVLVFLLLEHEAVRDRFIRIAGETDLRATTIALNEAGRRLSRFFVSQFSVNMGVGAVLWIGLAIIGVPHAMLWGTLAAALRFVPYVGVWIAALFSAVLAAAVDPGWSLAIGTLALFVMVELIASQVIEPQLFGHTTGMSPLSVVIAAVFWSWLWGPVGLVVSTPLTLCLVVAGRHIKALSLLDILLSDNHALTMPQRFYQRALSEDSDEIIAGARVFLKHDSFAGYCDLVLMPALHLAGLDVASGAISTEQQLKVRNTIVAVIAAIGGESHRLARRRRRVSVLDQSSAGRLLRQQREQLSGRWQGPLIVPPGSVVLCVSLGSIPDDLATELLVRILRDRTVDARHVSLGDLRGRPPAESSPDSISLVFLVSAFPNQERQGADSAAEHLRSRFPGVSLVTVFLPGMLLQPQSAIDTIRGADKAAGSFSEALHICLDWLQQRNKT